MSTHYQLFQENVAGWQTRADRLATYGFELSQARDLISTVGARTEIFLKTAVLPNSPPKQDFDGCINALKQLGVSRSDRDSLHDLRRIYNDSKHDPSYVPSMLELQAVIPQVTEVLHRFSETNRGLLNVEIPIRHHQVFWLAVWNHFIGGDSEVHVIAPARGGWPPTLDLVYVDRPRWDQIKDILSTFGRLRSAEGLIPAVVQRSFRDDSDFHEAVVFEGTFRDLIAVLATHERREDLLPGLRREDDGQAMMQAFVLATIDIAPQTTNHSSIEDLAAAISRRVVEAYAVPADYSLLQEASQGVAKMLKELPESKRNQVNGPIWIAKEEFQSTLSEALSKHSRLPVLIGLESTFLIQFPS
jgi:hypothetical protein